MSNLAETLEEKYFEQTLLLKQRVKELKIDLGKSESYIQELEHEIKSLKQKQGLTPEEKMEIKRGWYYDLLKSQLKSKSEKLRKLHKTNQELVVQICKLKQE